MWVMRCRLEEDEHLVLTPFEKNLEVWRQLWRVLERSDIVVQVPLAPLRQSHSFCFTAPQHACVLAAACRQRWHE